MREIHESVPSNENTVVIKSQHITKDKKMRLIFLKVTQLVSEHHMQCAVCEVCKPCDMASFITHPHSDGSINCVRCDMSN